MRILQWFFIALFCIGCSSIQGEPGLIRPIDQLISEVLTEEAPERSSVVGYLISDTQGLRLVGGMSFATEPPVALDAAPMIAVSGPLPTEIGLEPAGASRFGLVRVIGTVDRRDPQAVVLRDPQIEPITPRSVQLRDVLAAATSFEGQVLQIRGELLGARGTYLLLEELGPGGVPTGATRQIKLVLAADDPALAERLTNAGSAYYGPVEVIGIWSAGAIQTLAILPLTPEN